MGQQSYFKKYRLSGDAPLDYPAPANYPAPPLAPQSHFAPPPPPPPPPMPMQSPPQIPFQQEPQRAPVPIIDNSGDDDIDLSTHTTTDATLTVSTGDGDDVVRGSTHSDYIDTGRGRDRVELTKDLANDKITYEVSGSGAGGFVARGGSDVITNFEPGTDELIISLATGTSGNRTAQQEFMAGLGVSYHVRPEFDFVAETVTGVMILFDSGVVLPGGIATGSILRIVFDAPYSFAQFERLVSTEQGGDTYDFDHTTGTLTTARAFQDLLSGGRNDGGQGSIVVEDSSFTINVNDGPITGAAVWADLDDDGVIGAGDIYLGSTDSAGLINISSDYRRDDLTLLVDLEDAVDIYSGARFDNGLLRGKSTGTRDEVVVSSLTTAVQDLMDGGHASTEQAAINLIFRETDVSITAEDLQNTENYVPPSAKTEDSKQEIIARAAIGVQLVYETATNREAAITTLSDGYTTRDEPTSALEKRLELARATQNGMPTAQPKDLVLEHLFDGTAQSIVINVSQWGFSDPISNVARQSGRLKALTDLTFTDNNGTPIIGFELRTASNGFPATAGTFTAAELSGARLNIPAGVSGSVKVSYVLIDNDDNRSEPASFVIGDAGLPSVSNIAIDAVELAAGSGAPPDDIFLNTLFHDDTGVANLAYRVVARDDANRSVSLSTLGITHNRTTDSLIFTSDNPSAGEGVYTISITAADNSANSVVHRISFTIVAAEPTLTPGGEAAVILAGAQNLDTAATTFIFQGIIFTRKAGVTQDISFAVNQTTTKSNNYNSQTIAVVGGATSVPHDFRISLASNRNSTLDDVIAAIQASSLANPLVSVVLAAGVDGSTPIDFSDRSVIERGISSINTAYTLVAPTGIYTGLTFTLEDLDDDISLYQVTSSAVAPDGTTDASSSFRLAEGDGGFYRLEVVGGTTLVEGFYEITITARDPSSGGERVEQTFNFRVGALTMEMPQLVQTDTSYETLVEGALGETGGFVDTGLTFTLSDLDTPVLEYYESAAGFEFLIVHVGGQVGVILNDKFRLVPVDGVVDGNSEEFRLEIVGGATLLAGAYQISITTTNGTQTATYLSSITNLVILADAAPEFGAAPMANAIVENADHSGNGMAKTIATVSATDADVDDTVSYSLNAAAELLGFAINSSGVITYAGTGFDYEMNQSIEVLATATSTGISGKPQTDTQAISVPITNVGDSLPTGVATYRYTDKDGDGTLSRNDVVILDFSAVTDPDGLATNQTAYVWSVNVFEGGGVNENVVFGGARATTATASFRVPNYGRYEVLILVEDIFGQRRPIDSIFFTAAESLLGDTPATLTAIDDVQNDLNAGVQGAEASEPSANFQGIIFTRKEGLTEEISFAYNYTTTPSNNGSAAIQVVFPGQAGYDFRISLASRSNPTLGAVIDQIRGTTSVNALVDVELAEGASRSDTFNYSAIHRTTVASRINTVATLINQAESVDTGLTFRFADADLDDLVSEYDDFTIIAKRVGDSSDRDYGAFFRMLPIDGVEDDDEEIYRLEIFGGEVFEAGRYTITISTTFAGRPLTTVQTSIVLVSAEPTLEVVGEAVETLVPGVQESDGASVIYKGIVFTRKAGITEDISFGILRTGTTFGGPHPRVDITGAPNDSFGIHLGASGSATLTQIIEAIKANSLSNNLVDVSLLVAGTGGDSIDLSGIGEGTGFSDPDVVSIDVAANNIDTGFLFTLTDTDTNVVDYASGTRITATRNGESVANAAEIFALTPTDGTTDGFEEEFRLEIVNGQTLLGGVYEVSVFTTNGIQRPAPVSVTFAVASSEPTLLAGGEAADVEAGAVLGGVATVIGGIRFTLKESATAPVGVRFQRFESLPANDPIEYDPDVADIIYVRANSTSFLVTRQQIVNYFNDPARDFDVVAELATLGTGAQVLPASAHSAGIAPLVSGSNVDTGLTFTLTDTDTILTEYASGFTIKVMFGFTDVSDNFILVPNDSAIDSNKEVFRLEIVGGSMLEQGDYAITITATDGGAQTSYEASTTFTVLSAPPTLTAGKREDAPFAVLSGTQSIVLAEANPSFIEIFGMRIEASGTTDLSGMKIEFVARDSNYVVNNNAYNPNVRVTENAAADILFTVNYIEGAEQANKMLAATTNLGHVMAAIRGITDSSHPNYSASFDRSLGGRAAGRVSFDIEALGLKVSLLEGFAANHDINTVPGGHANNGRKFTATFSAPVVAETTDADTGITFTLADTDTSLREYTGGFAVKATRQRGTVDESDKFFVVVEDGKLSGDSEVLSLRIKDGSRLMADNYKIEVTATSEDGTQTVTETTTLRITSSPTKARAEVLQLVATAVKAGEDGNNITVTTSFKPIGGRTDIEVNDDDPNNIVITLHFVPDHGSYTRGSWESLAARINAHEEASQYVDITLRPGIQSSQHVGGGPGLSFTGELSGGRGAPALAPRVFEPPKLTMGGVALETITAGELRIGEDTNAVAASAVFHGIRFTALKTGAAGDDIDIQFQLLRTSRLITILPADDGKSDFRIYLARGQVEAVFTLDEIIMAVNDDDDNNTVVRAELAVAGTGDTAFPTEPVPRDEVISLSGGGATNGNTGLTFRLEDADTEITEFIEDFEIVVMRGDVDESDKFALVAVDGTVDGNDEVFRLEILGGSVLEVGEYAISITARDGGVQESQTLEATLNIYSNPPTIEAGGDALDIITGIKPDGENTGITFTIADIDTDVGGYLDTLDFRVMRGSVDETSKFELISPDGTVDGNEELFDLRVKSGATLAIGEYSVSITVDDGGADITPSSATATLSVISAPPALTNTRTQAGIAEGEDGGIALEAIESFAEMHGLRFEAADGTDLGGINIDFFAAANVGTAQAFRAHGIGVNDPFVRVADSSAADTLFTIYIFEKGNPGFDTRLGQIVTAVQNFVSGVADTHGASGLSVSLATPNTGTSYINTASGNPADGTITEAAFSEYAPALSWNRDGEIGEAGTASLFGLTLTAKEGAPSNLQFEFSAVASSFTFDGDTYNTAGAYVFSKMVAGENSFIIYVIGTPSLADIETAIEAHRVSNALVSVSAAAGNYSGGTSSVSAYTLATPNVDTGLTFTLTDADTLITEYEGEFRISVMRGSVDESAKFALAPKDGTIDGNSEIFNLEIIGGSVLVSGAYDISIIATDGASQESVAATATLNVDGGTKAEGRILELDLTAASGGVAGNNITVNASFTPAGGATGITVDDSNPAAITITLHFVPTGRPNWAELAAQINNHAEAGEYIFAEVRSGVTPTQTIGGGAGRPTTTTLSGGTGVSVANDAEPTIAMSGEALPITAGVQGTGVITETKSSLEIYGIRFEAKEFGDDLNGRLIRFRAEGTTSGALSINEVTVAIEAPLVRLSQRNNPNELFTIQFAEGRTTNTTLQDIINAVNGIGNSADPRYADFDRSTRDGRARLDFDPSTLGITASLVTPNTGGNEIDTNGNNNGVSAGTVSAGTLTGAKDAADPVNAPTGLFFTIADADDNVEDYMPRAVVVGASVGDVSSLFTLGRTATAGVWELEVHGGRTLAEDTYSVTVFASSEKQTTPDATATLSITPEPVAATGRVLQLNITAAKVGEAGNNITVNTAFHTAGGEDRIIVNDDDPNNIIITLNFVPPPNRPTWGELASAINRHTEASEYIKVSVRGGVSPNEGSGGGGGTPRSDTLEGGVGPTPSEDVERPVGYVPPDLGFISVLQGEFTAGAGNYGSRDEYDYFTITFADNGIIAAGDRYAATITRADDFPGNYTAAGIINGGRGDYQTGTAVPKGTPATMFIRLDNGAAFTQAGSFEIQFRLNENPTGDPYGLTEPSSVTSNNPTTFAFYTYEYFVNAVPVTVVGGSHGINLRVSSTSAQDTGLTVRTTDADDGNTVNGVGTTNGDFDYRIETGGNDVTDQFDIASNGRLSIVAGATKLTTGTTSFTITTTGTDGDNVVHTGANEYEVADTTDFALTLLDMI